MTNDVKEKSPAQCTHEMSEVVSKAKEKLPNAKIVILLATPRDDCHKQKSATFNGMIREMYKLIEPIYSVIMTTYSRVVKPHLAYWLLTIIT